MRILAIGANWLGDAILTLPALQALQAMFPAARIAVRSRGATVALYAMSPVVQPQDGPADCAVVFPRSFGAAWRAWRAGIPRRIGYATPGRSWLLTDPVEPEPALLAGHRATYYHRLVGALGDLPPLPKPQLRIPPQAERDARTLLGSWADRPDIVAVHAGATYGQAKRWPPERFARLLKVLDSPIALIGSAHEAALARGIAPRHARVYAGLTSVPVLAALLRRCRVLVGNDSGPMHLAAAAGTPVVAIFGSTDPRATGPLGDGHVVLRRPIACSPCLERTCPLGHLRCMHAIEVDEVLRAVRRFL